MSQQELPDIRERLGTYVKTFYNEKIDMDAVIERINKTEHKPFLDTICDYFIRPNNDKGNTVWVHGAASSGKSNFLKCMREIFTCADY